MKAEYLEKELLSCLRKINIDSDLACVAVVAVGKDGTSYRIYENEGFNSGDAIAAIGSMEMLKNFIVEMVRDRCEPIDSRPNLSVTKGPESNKDNV